MNEEENGATSAGTKEARDEAEGTEETEAADGGAAWKETEEAREADEA